MDLETPRRSGLAKQRPSRRDVLSTATWALGALGAGAAAWPFVAQMNPAADVRGDETVVDLSAVAEGQAIRVTWLGKPLYIRHRTGAEIEAARDVPLDIFPDSDARLVGVLPAQTASDDNRTRHGHAEWLVVAGDCTRDGCLLQGNRPGEFRGDYGGWFCPCCAAHYDTSGRTRTGIAPRNLAVPPYRFIGTDRIALALHSGDGSRWGGG